MSTPDRLIVDTEKETRSLFFTPELEKAIPDLYNSFWQANEDYRHEIAIDGARSYLEKLSSSVFSFQSGAGGTVHCSLLHENSDYLSQEVLTMWAPFSDVPPQTSAVKTAKYLAKEKPNFLDIQSAQPNSWNQITKSANAEELLRALGRSMPVLTIFSPVTLMAYTANDRLKFWRGDFSPASQILEAAVAHAQDQIHGSRSETQLSTLHVHGASLGAHNALASASELAIMNDKYNIGSVTTQELIMGPENIADLAGRFVVNKVVGEPSNIKPDENWERIFEPGLRREMDAHGNELKMFGRMLKGMSKLAYMKGLTDTDPESTFTMIDIECLLEKRVPLTVALAKNSSLTRQTADNLLKHRFGSDLDIINIEAVAGQKVDHLADEHVSLLTAVAALGINRASVTKT